MYHNLKVWLSQKCELQSFVFQKVPIRQRLSANQLGGFQYNFRCLKRFFRKVLQKLRSAFLLKLRFLKIRLFVTWLMCLFFVNILNGLLYWQQNVHHRCSIRLYINLRWSTSSRLLQRIAFLVSFYECSIVFLWVNWRSFWTSLYFDPFPSIWV